jgi:transcription elongation factor Elf1
MQVFCSNCNTAHEVSRYQAGDKDRSVIHCRRCDKKIKLQFCPHCGSFYSITFANIKSGRYKYRCRKCMKDFAIEFSEEFSEPALIRKNVITEEPAAKIQTESNEHQIGNR